MAENTAKKTNEMLESELDKLLAQIAQRVPEAKIAVNAVAAPVMPATDPVVAAPAVNEAAPAPAEDLVGDKLAQQIQDLLDDSRAQQALLESNSEFATPPVSEVSLAPESAVPPPPPAPPELPPELPSGFSPELTRASSSASHAESTAPASPTTVSDADIAAMIAAAASPDQAEASPQPATVDEFADFSAPPAEPGEPASSAPAQAEASSTAQEIAQIDDHLAHEADAVITGDFETVQEVITRAPSEPAPTATLMSNSAPRQPTVAVDESPMSAQAADAKLSAGASAVDVAQELDSQPERRPAAGAAAKVAAKPATPRKPKGPGLVFVLSAMLRSLLGTINGPMVTASPFARSAVGYSGLLTLFVGSVVVSWKLAGHFLGHH